MLNYRLDGGGMNIAIALVSGYTVESVESRIKAGVSNIFGAIMLGVEPHERQEVFAREVTEFVSKVIREDQLQSG